MAEEVEHCKEQLPRVAVGLKTEKTRYRRRPTNPFVAPKPPSSPTAAGGIARTVCGKGVDMGPTRRLSKFCVCDTLEVVGGELVIANCQRPL